MKTTGLQGTKRPSRLCHLALILTIVLPAVSAAQPEPLPFFLASTDDSVYILAVGMPRGTEGFMVYRKGPADKEFLPRTPFPVAPVIDPDRARFMLGEDYSWVLRTLRVEDAFDIVQRLRSDPGASATLSFASLRVARVAGRLFIDDSVQAGTSYTYRVDFLDYDGSVRKSASRRITVHDRRPPAPERIKVTAGDGRVKISWEYPPYRGDPNDITIGFNIYRRTRDGEFQKINRVLALRQEDLKYRTDINVENNATYTYHVRAVDFIGRESEPSVFASATPKDITPPSFPEGLDAISKEGAILLTWRMNLELDLSHYDVYRSLDMQGEYEKINASPIAGDHPSYLDTTVYAGPTYFYQVKAVDTSGNESEFSNIITAFPLDTTPPSPPVRLAGTTVEQNVLLRWEAPADRDLKGYYVYRKKPGETDFMRLTGTVLPKGELQYEDRGFTGKGLWGGKDYVYGVSSVDNSFNESAITTITITVPDLEPPTPPVGSNARGNRDGSILVYWQPSMSLDVAAYRVYREPPDGSAPIFESDKKTFEFVDSSAVPGTTYSYRVSAVDNYGNESEKTPATEVTARDLDAPPPPGRVSAVVVKDGIRVTWEDVEEHDLRGYNVYRMDIPNGVAEKINDEPIRATVFLDTGGSAGQYYRVTTLDTSGNENHMSRAVEAVTSKTK